MINVSSLGLTFFYYICMRECGNGTKNGAKTALKRAQNAKFRIITKKIYINGKKSNESSSR